MPKAKKNPKKPIRAWKGIPSPDKEGWQYLFLYNPRTNQLAKVEIPKRYAVDKRGYPFPDKVTYAKVKGVLYFSNKRENYWDAKIAKKTIDRLFSAGFQIVPPDQIKVMTASDAKKFTIPFGGILGKKKRGNRGEDGSPLPGEDGGELFILNEGDMEEPPDDTDEDLFSSSPGKFSGKQGQPEENKQDQSSGNGSGNKDQEQDKPPQANDEDYEVNPQPQTKPYEQYGQDTPESDEEFSSKGHGVNDREDEFEEEPLQDEKDTEEARRLAEENERIADEKAKNAEKGENMNLLETEGSAQQYYNNAPKAPRKRRGNRRRLGQQVTEVDQFARGNAGDGSRVRGIYSYSEITFNSKVYSAARKSAELLSNFVGKSQAMIEYGVKPDIPDFLIRLKGGDNPLPSLERPNERPKMKVMITPDCSPSTQPWNGLACAWAIMLAKNPDLDVLYCVNSNGDPVKVSSEKYLTLMRSSDIIIYLGDSDAMSHNKEWARDFGLHVICLSSVHTSIGVVPQWKIKQNKVHLIVQKYGRGVLRYATGVSDKDPRTWARALNLCLNSLEY